MLISLPRLNSSAFQVRVPRFLALLLLLFLGGEFGQAQAAVALVQHTGKDAGTTTTSTLAFVSPNTAGDFIAVVIRGGLSSSQVFTVADSNGNSYKQAAQIGYTASVVTSAIYYAENIKGGANTVTVSMTVSGPLRFAILEYSGVATANSLDATATATATSTAPNSGNLTTTMSGDLLLATVGTTNPATFTAGAGYTIRDFVPAEPNTKLISEDQVQTSAGLTSVGASITASDSWGAVLAAFKPAGGVAGSPATIAATAGTPQSATVNTAFGMQLQATVKDPFNSPVSGATVTFTAPASGASGTFANGTASTTATTDASGVATSSTFTANGVAGGYTVTASVSGITANFALTNLAGAPASIAATAGTPQSAAINTAFATQLQATVIDSLNNPVSGVTVTFTAPTSGASGTFAGGVNTATTNAQGIATAPVFTANGTTGGPYTVTASVSGVSTPANFSLTNLATSPFTWGNMDEWMQMNTSSPGTALTSAILAAGSVGSRFSSWTLDQSKNVVSSTSAFTVAASQGSMGGSVTVNGVTYPVGTTTQALALNNNVNFTYVTTSNVSAVKQVVANGFITFGQANAGTAGGKNVDMVLLNDSNSAAAVVFQLNNGNPCYCVRVESNGAVGFHLSSNITITPGHRYSFSLLFDEIGGTAKLAIFDPSNNFAQVGSTVSVVQNTGFNFASFRFGNAEAGTSSGTTSFYEDLMLDWTNHVFPNTPHAVGGAGTPATITATAGTPQSATVNTVFATQLQATVKDTFGTAVSGATVTFTAPGSGASGTFAGGVNTATTNASGVATAAVFTANTTAGGPYTVSATVTGVSTPANFSQTNLAGSAASIAATAGTPQSATINTAYATQLQATVKDAFNNPVSGVTVTFTAPGSGASGTFASGVTTATTNASGVATAAVFTANTTAGAYVVTASVSGVGSSASFSLTNLAGAAASIAATSGTPQSAAVNTAFPTQLQATVTDSFNNPVSGVTVTFTAPASGASGAFAGGVKTAATNASGLATAPVFTANTAAGAYTVSASVSGVSTPANFSLTNLAGAAASIAASAGTPQSASINTAFATQLQATVKDSFGNGVSGVTVTFAAPGSGASGTFAGGVNTATTNASGVATAAVFTANGTAGGPYTVTASATGVTGSASFSLTNLGNPPANIAAAVGTPQSATINTAFAAQLQVTVTDSGNNPVNGVTVTFTAPGSGASGTFAGGVNTGVTNASGVATSAVFTANSVAGGPYTVTATVSGVATPANFSLTNLTGAAASITAMAGTPQSATINTAYPTAFQATVKDAGGNPVNGVTVTFAAPGSGASGTFAGGVNTATTNSAGIATATAFTANTTAGAYTVTASVTGVATPASFSLTNLAGTPSSIAATAGTPQSATVNTAFTTQLQATVTDSFNNPVSGVTVTFTAPTSGASGTFAGGVNTATTKASGVATAPVFSANNVVGGPYTVTASVAGVATPANFSLTNLAAVAAPIALVQHIGKDAGTATTSTLAFASANTAGNFIAVAIRGGLSNAQVFTVSDSNGNTYKKAAQVGYANSAVTSAIYYAENIKGGANTVTVTMSVSGPLRFDILEYSNVATSNSLDVTAVGTATSSSPATSSVNTAVAGELLLTTIGSTNAATFTAGTGYTIRDFVPVEPNTKHIAEDQIQSAAGAASGSASLSASDSWGAILAAFKPGTGGGGAGVPASITATAGTPQSATVNTAFAVQLQATVKDSLNNPVSGVTVTFAAPGSGASGTFAGGVTTATTNASGVATAAIFTASTVAGGYTVTATVSGVSTPANFSLTNLAGSAASIAATAGTPQSATINTAFATQLQATVKDAFNNPVSGIMVMFTAPASGASGTFAGGVNTATTNASGVATAPVFTANNTSGGPYTVTASVAGVASPANFSLTNLAAPPASITATAGTPQSATVNTAFTTAFQVTVKDASNNPVSGVTVTLTAPGSGASGTFAGGVNTATTNSLGVATAAVFTANAIAGGPYNVTASVAGVSTPANFSLTNVAGSAATITATAGTPQSAAINTAFATQLQATVTDSLSNPVSGVTVTFTAPASGASGTFAGGVNTATTNASGVATAPVFTANATAGGPYTVTASASGVANPANFSLTNVAGSGNIALVQHRNLDAGTSTSGALAFATNTTAGNWIAVCIRGGSSNSQVFTVSDSNGNTYHQAFRLGLSATAVTFAIYYAENITGGADTITVTQSVSGPLRFAILEYSGVATSNSIDATPALAQGNSATPNSGNLTTGASGDLLLAAIVTTNGDTVTAGNGYILEESVPAAPNTKLIAEDQLQTSAGTASASASLSGTDNWGAGLAAFRSISGVALPVSVSVSPSTASVPSGYGTQVFTATTSNDFQNRGATWSLSGTGCSGSTCGTLTQVTTTSATYNAPASVPNPATVNIIATSIGDPTKSGSSVITVTQGTLHVSISPRRAGVTMSGSQTVQFTATIVNDPQNLGVTWQVDGNNGGNSTTGTISATGLFTPGTQPGQHTVTAVSNANASVSASAMAAVTDLTGVYTQHNDNARTGQNLKEYGLTVSTVNTTTFGQLFSCPVDGMVYAQPLWVANVTVGAASHNVVYVATENDTVYAFDADSPSCVQLWKTSFLGTGVTPLSPSDIQGNLDIGGPVIGITSTPVIDPATNTLYVMPKTRETVGTVNGQACSTGTPCYVHRLHALDLASGAEKFGGPAVVTATNFNSLRHLQRTALLLANGTIYLGFGSHGDQCPYFGWVMGYNASTLAQVFAKPLTNPTSGCRLGAGGAGAGGVWMSGAGPAADSSGNVYVSTGNGAYDGSSNWGDSAVKLSPTGSILDWFTPFNQSTFFANDVDLSSAGIVILPSSVGSAAHPNLAISTGKVAILYLLDVGTCSPQPCTTMGKFNSSSNNDVQEVIPVPPPNTTLADGGNYVDPAYWNGFIYTTGQNFPLSQFTISNGLISSTQFAKSSNTFPPRGGEPSVAANGNTAGVVWITDYTGWQNNTSAILDAYDATNVGTMLYSSPATGAGSLGPAVKFTTPTVANSKVYVGTQNSLTVYGLLP